MYRSFYGLKEKPFNQTPDPRYLYLTTAHREALASLQYGVEQRAGFLALTGDVGTGKTTLLRTLVSRLDRATHPVFLFSPNLDYDGILDYLLADLGVDVGEVSRARRLHALHRFLFEGDGEGRRVLLIVDEAQLVTPETLEQVRLLSNLETASEKLLQILLVGQPELRDKLNLPELRQLKQRVGLRCTIRPLTDEEVPLYLAHRLRVAGASEPGVFLAEASDRIAGYSRGIPRVVNMVAEHALVVGFADGSRQIGRDIVEQAIEYLQQGEPEMQPTVRPAISGARARLAALGWSRPA